MAREALTDARVFTGERFLDGHAVLFADGAVEALVPLAEIPADAKVTALGGGILAPGFIDAQVNGGGGVLFNATPDADALARLAQAHGRFGTTAMLPTFITDKAQGMDAAIKAMRAAIAGGVPGVVGIHLEGPFLSRSRKGAHDPDLIRPLTEEDAG